MLPYHKFEEKKILINDLEANYKTAGQGPAILVLHGWGGSSDSWIKVQEIMAGNNYQVIVPDFPGFGKSAVPQSIWSVDDYVSWVKRFADLLNLDKFFLLGHSFGGRISIRFAVKYPEKIKKLILCDAAGIKQQINFKTWAVFQVAKFGNALFSPKILRRFKDSARNFLYVFLRRTDYVKSEGMMKEIIKKILEEDLSSDLPKIRIKTLIVWGKADRMVPIKYARIINERIQDSKLEIIPKIGHSPHLEAPERLAEIMNKFFID